MYRRPPLLSSPLIPRTRIAPISPPRHRRHATSPSHYRHTVFVVCFGSYIVSRTLGFAIMVVACDGVVVYEPVFAAGPEDVFLCTHGRRLADGLVVSWWYRGQNMLVGIVA